MTDSSSPVDESIRRIVARCVGSPTAALLPNTVTSFVPSAPLAGMNAGITPKNAWLGADLEHRPQRLLHAPGRKLRQGRFHGLDEIVHGQQLANVWFRKGEAWRLDAG